MTKYEEVFSVEGKTLDDCTMEELIAIAYEEKIAAPAEVTKEELAELIRANHTGETEGNEPEVEKVIAAEEIQSIEGVNEIPEGAEVVDGVVISTEENNENNEEPEVKDNEEIDEIVIGCVNVAKLNVREEANKTAKIVTVIAKDSEVEINLSESTDDFYRVINVNGEETFGYCVKEFITIK